jgi:hypothetical protein
MELLMDRTVLIQQGSDLAWRICSDLGLTVRLTEFDEGFAAGAILPNTTEATEADSIVKLRVMAFDGPLIRQASGLVPVELPAELVRRWVADTLPVVLIACWPASGDALWIDLKHRCASPQSGDTRRLLLKYEGDRLDKRFFQFCFSAQAGEMLTVEALFTALSDVIRFLNDAEILCMNTFGRSLDAITGSKPLDATLVGMIEQARAKGLVRRLIDMARQYHCDSSALRRLSGMRFPETEWVSTPLQERAVRSAHEDTTVTFTENEVIDGETSITGANRPTQSGGTTKVAVERSIFRGGSVTVVGVRGN